MTGVTYRVAYLTGRAGGFGVGCGVYHSDAILYNPARLVNVTQTIGGSVAHDTETPTLFGVPHVRRSLPLCNRGTNLMRLETLIDGPPQTDKCGRATPSGPANVVFNKDGHIVGSHVRFAFVHRPGEFIDVFNMHPNGGQEQADKFLMQRLVESLSPPPYAGASLLYPPVMAGDFNMLEVESNFPKFITAVPPPQEDVPRIMIGATDAFPARLRVRTVQKLVVPDLPGGMLCQGSTKYLVSDHCGLFARFDIDGANAAQLRGVFVDGPETVASAVPFRLQAVPSGGGPNFAFKWQPGGEATEVINGLVGSPGTAVTFGVTVTDKRTGQTASGTHKVAFPASGPTPHQRCLQACSDQLAKCKSSAHGGAGQKICTEEALQCRNDCPP